MLTESHTKRGFTVDEYMRMFDLGILDPDERLELIDGDILVVPPPGPEHNSRVMRFNRFLNARLNERALIMIDGTAIVAGDSAPEPDIALLSLRDDFYEKANPRPSDILAIVEVSSTSLRFDRGRKYRLYARAGIPEYWIVDVAGRTIERCRKPVGDGYTERIVFRIGETIAFDAFPDCVFQISDLVGPPGT